MVPLGAVLGDQGPGNCWRTCLSISWPSFLSIQVFLRMSISCGVAGTPDGTGGRGVGVLAELRVEGEAELVMLVALVDLDTGSRGVICSYLGRRALEQ